MKYVSMRELIDLCTDQDDIIYELREENARLREALEFYSNPSAWGVAGKECVAIDPSDWESYPFSEFSTSNEFRGGMRARKALEKGE